MRFRRALFVEILGFEQGNVLEQVKNRVRAAEARVLHES